MPERYNNGYGQELIRLMAEALESAWSRTSVASRDAELARLVMANAIIERIDDGVLAHDALVSSAKQALMIAMSLSGERH